MNKKMLPKLTLDEVEAFGRLYYGTGDSFEDLANLAVHERGGHCLNCQHCKNIFGKKPVPTPHILQQQNISVRVVCDIDSGRRYPFRVTSLGQEQCPSLRRHSKRRGLG
jgi:hypothetical protein